LCRFLDAGMTTLSTGSCGRRPKSAKVSVVRDQFPMTDAGLLRCLPNHISPADWYKLLNQKVFFWLTKDRLIRLLNAGNLLIGVGSRRRSASQAIDVPNDRGVSLVPLFTSNCAELADTETEAPIRLRYRRMETPWLAIASDQSWLDGQIPLSKLTNISFK
jgi:hypothetical protein